MSLSEYLLRFWDIDPEVTDHDARVHIAICIALRGVVEDFPIHFPEGFHFPEPVEVTLRRFFEEQGAAFTRDPIWGDGLWNARWPDGVVYKVNATYFQPHGLLLVTITDNTELERRIKDSGGK